jgi:lipoprotein-anchoring transpeptidase ErfK/SrfK
MHRPRTLVPALLLTTLVGAAFSSPLMAANPILTPDSINMAPLDEVPEREALAARADPLMTNNQFTIGAPPEASGFSVPPADEQAPLPSIARLQILLDRAGVSPGVIDGLDGGNVRSAIEAFQAMHGLPVDGEVDARVIAALDEADQVIGSYVIKSEDLADVVGPIPEDYAEMAKMPSLGYSTAIEALAEQFHMDDQFLRLLNPNATFTEGETIFVADLGADKQGQAARLEVDKSKGQLRAYTADGDLLVAYPATIGSEDNPSPSGTHTVKVVVERPTYTYNPKVNFQQGSNDEVLTLPPGPNGPVGTMWIDLSEPTFGIHGSAEPTRIDKTGSHGCVRLTNWDVEELGKLVEEGAQVEFL